MESLIAVYDACVLYPAFLRDLLVHVAVHGMRKECLRAKWTGRIHREWIGAVRRQRPDVALAGLRRTRRLMDQHVRGCRVRGYQRWEPRLQLPDPNDRHVLAAALACVADLIVTYNVRDFPSGILRPFGMEAVTPDTFLLRLQESSTIVTAAAAHRASLTRPPLSVAEYLDALRRNGLSGTATALEAEHAGRF
jgi:hypothetical protein